MNRNTVIPIVGVVLALIVLFFIFFSSRPDPDADVVGDGGGLEVGEDGVPVTADEEGAGD